MITKTAYKTIAAFIQFLPAELLHKIMALVVKQLNITGKNFISYQVRPKYADDIKLSTKGCTYEDFAIILQGPVITEENFTLETVKLYTKIFPDVAIIVSTWNNLNIEAVHLFQECGATVILNEPPKSTGTFNINYQLLSTSAGLKKAEHLNRKYSIKTRTDQRIYNSFFLSAVQLLPRFPIDSKYNLKSRLIVSSMSTLTYRPYGITDMLMLGLTADLLTYWDIPADERSLKFEEVITIKEYAKLRVTETYILSQFLVKQGVNLDFSLQQTWEIYKGLFIVLDKSTFNVYWYKYSRERENKLEFYDEHIYNELSFLEWLALNEITIYPEEMLDSPMVPYNP